jgi:transcriptional regulator with XRE-family HTH domain
MVLINSKKALQLASANFKVMRLEKGLTQSGLSKRSGVALASLRKFEQKGMISLESFFKLALSLGCLEKLIDATHPENKAFSSIDDVLNNKTTKKPQRGWRK